MRVAYSIGIAEQLRPGNEAKVHCNMIAPDRADNVSTNISHVVPSLRARVRETNLYNITRTDMLKTADSLGVKKGIIRTLVADRALERTNVRGGASPHTRVPNATLSQSPGQPSSG